MDHSWNVFPFRTDPYGERSEAPGSRPRVPGGLQSRVRTMATHNPNWWEKQIAAELLLKVGIQVSPRAVRYYMPRVTGGGKRSSSQRRSNFLEYQSMPRACTCVMAMRMVTRCWAAMDGARSRAFSGPS